MALARTQRSQQGSSRTTGSKDSTIFGSLPYSDDFEDEDGDYDEEEDDDEGDDNSDGGMELPDLLDFEKAKIRNI